MLMISEHKLRGFTKNLIFNILKLNKNVSANTRLKHEKKNIEFLLLNILLEVAESSEPSYTH